MSRSGPVPGAAASSSQGPHAVIKETPSPSGKTSSSSSRSSSPASLNSDAAIPNYHEVQTLQWFILARSRVMHFVQEVEDGSLVPMCRSSPFSARVAEQGNDPTSQVFAVCSRCVRRLAPDVREALRRGQTTDSPTLPSSDNELE